MNAPPASDEAARLDALSQYKILDTAPEQAFDDLTQLAAQICQTSMALISFVDAERLWFKSQVGWKVGGIPRDAGFCADAILQPGLFVVRDALEDERYATKPPVVSDPHIRFYAGAPLVTAEGYRLARCAFWMISRWPHARTGRRSAHAGSPGDAAVGAEAQLDLPGAGQQGAGERDRRPQAGRGTRPVPGIAPGSSAQRRRRGRLGRKDCLLEQGCPEPVPLDGQRGDREKHIRGDCTAG